MNTSFEFFPPKSETGEKQLRDLATKLSSFSPEYFSVTYGAGGSTRQKTLETCLSIQKLGHQACPHLSGIGASKKSIENILNEYKSNGLKKIIALRGDLPSGIGGHGDFPFALDLINFIKITDSSFSIQVAAYPEIHPEAKSEDSDFKNFLRKVDAGVDGAITQFFFEEDCYYRFLEKSQKENVSIPIIPGIMPIHNFEALIRMAKTCSANIPSWLNDGMREYLSDKDRLKYGIEVVTDLCQNLLDNGATGLHF